MCDLIDDNSEESGGNEETTIEQLFMALSEVTVSEKDSPRTLKIRGSI
jgi:hypothetical protein